VFRVWELEHGRRIKNRERGKDGKDLRKDLGELQ
jgi:hypothetical protein